MNYYASAPSAEWEKLLLELRATGLSPRSIRSAVKGYKAAIDSLTTNPPSYLDSDHQMELPLVEEAIS